MKHFTPEDLKAALRDGMTTEEDRHRALLHFGGACPDCHGAFKSLLGEPLPEDDLDPPDIFSRALWRWLAAARGEPVKEAFLTGVYLYWIERAIREPTAFPRLVIEEALIEVISGRGEPVVLRDLIETFSDARLLGLGEGRWHDLRALVHVYLGTLLTPRRGMWAYSDGPHSLLFSIANEHLKKGSGDPEILALVHLHQGETIISLIDRERPILEDGEKHMASFFEVRSSAGHVADMHCLAGYAELRLTHERRGKVREARKSFSLACDTYPRACLYRRFAAAYEAARLSYQLSEPEAAHRYLAIARAVFEEHAFEVHAGSLSWLSGCLERLADRPAKSFGKA